MTARGTLDGLGLRLLSHMMRRFVQNGTLRLIDSEGETHEFAGTPEPFVTVRLLDPSLPFKLFRSPELHAGEAYMDGRLELVDCELRDFLNLFSINRSSMADYPLQKVVRRFGRAIRPLQQRNPIGLAEKNVSHHYDLSRELYELFLDEDMQYTCAYFAEPGFTLEQAQAAKKRHIAAKLRLEPGQRILDIGSGWGGLAFDLARRADVEVVGVTLSKEQHKVSVERAKAEGLSDRVHFELCDYRELDGRFDRMVSVGMFEQVGIQHFDEYFGWVYEHLADDGLALLHSIGHMSPPGTASAWLRKYIFPGAYSPSLSETFASTERQHLWVNDVEVLRLHYADTLVEWNKRFQLNRERIAEIYDERFCRMWEFYLQGVETMFRTGAQMVFQVLLSRTREAAGTTRDWMVDTERAYRESEAEPAVAAR